MTLPSINFIRSKSGTGRQLPGEDHISGMVFYMANGNLPSGFDTGNRNKVVYSVQDAIDLGILDDFSDETACTAGEVQITAAGAAGTTWTVTIPNPLTGSSVTLATYVVQTGDAVADISAGINTSLNATTSSHGYTSTVLTDTATISAPVGYGLYPSTVTLTATNSGAGTDTTTQFVGTSAEGSFMAIMRYHISEFFRMNSQGVLYLGIQSNAAFDGTGIIELQDYSQGKIRQMGVFITEDSTGVNAGKAFATSLIDTVQTEITTLQTNNKPVQALVVSDVKGDALSSLADLTTLSDQNVTPVFGQDRGNYGYLLSLAYGYSVSDMGTLLGAISSAQVHQSIAWVDKFNITGTVTQTNGNNFTLVQGTEHDEAGFATGDKYEGQSNSLLQALNAKSIVFQLKHVGSTGTYWSDTWTATAQSSDLCYVETNRTIDKAVRGSRTNLLPYLNASIVLNPDGTLTNSSIALLEDVTGKALRDMEKSGELSAWQVLIDDSQVVSTTDTIAITIELVKVAVGRTFNINIGFVVALS